MKKIAAALFAGFVLAGCGGDLSSTSKDSNAETNASSDVTSSVLPERYEASEANAASLNAIGEDFVKLALAVGQHDAAFVDAYHGPEEWAQAAKSATRTLEALETEAQGLLISVARTNADESTVRGAMLEKLTRAALTRVQMLQGEVFSFNEETRLLYDAIPRDYDLAEFDEALAQIERLLPGDTPLHERVDAFRNTLAIPKDKLQTVFDAAIAECRRRTLSHYDLPDTESFSLAFVTDKPWSGYNWYQGDFESLIQVNTDFPIIIDRAVDLGCHEGYPGHHTWNIMLERFLLKEKGWIEYSVYPLFSPMSVMAEGSANYGIELAFPGDEKIAFERDVLFPLAGFDPGTAETLAQLNKYRSKLGHARNHIAREYLDGRLTREEAIVMTMKYRLEARDRAEQGMRFVDTYRGYVINYTLGRDLVDGFVEAGVAEGRDPWDVFETLLMTPLAASDILAAQ
ncbi:MAG: hypothetical protein V3V10_04960 [Planctomycetota bacterium]